MYIHQRKEWPRFSWEENELVDLLTEVRYLQGRLYGRMEALGFNLQEEATLQTFTQDVLKSSEIEGELLNPDQVRSSIARRLGIEVAGLVPSDRHVDGVVDMMLDATQRYSEPLTAERLFGWHSSLFPSGRSGMQQLVVGQWRTNTKDDPMQVVSGPMGREKVHFQAPDAELLDEEMGQFLHWFNGLNSLDPVLTAGLAHLWFVTIHPFDDGNGRIARAITDMQLARADNSTRRFYSLSAQIRTERKEYYDMLESTQKGDMNITPWLKWFLECCNRALSHSGELLDAVLKKARLWEHPGTRDINERQRLMLNKLSDHFVGKLTSSKWANIAKCSQDTATRDIQDLVRRGVLLKEAAGGRSTSYQLNTEL
ncbi:MAG: Fic family protein [Chitinophagaceae bacterium]|nr:Fic family protein [Chitinophagaceae bacterium]